MNGVAFGWTACRRLQSASSRARLPECSSTSTLPKLAMWPGGACRPAMRFTGRSMRRREGVMRSTATVLATYVGTAGFTAVLTLYLVRALSPAQYGSFSLAMGVASLTALVADFGVAAS